MDITPSDWFTEELIKKYDAGLYSYRAISEEYGIPYKTVESRFYRYRLANRIPLPKNEEEHGSSIEYHKDGTIISQKFITVRDGQDMTPEFIMEAHGLKPTEWTVVSYKNNFWNTQVKGGKKQISYQSKITVKPKTCELNEEHIDRYFENKKFKYDKPLTIPLNYDPNGEILEIDLPDLHGGLLSWRKETGEDYDVHIAKEHFYQCLYDIIDRCRYKKLSKIYFVTLGDLLHVDNDKQETTKGTFQQSDGRMAKIYDAILDMLIDGVTILGTLAPTEVVYLPGNHDRLTGRMLLMAVKTAFRNDNNITFDMDPNPQKYKLMGKVLVGWTHGDMPEKNMALWLQQIAKKEYGQSKFSEVHAAHFHSQKTKERKLKMDYDQTAESGGVVVRYLPTICNASYWEHQQGFSKSVKTMMSFVWNTETGLREMWYSNII